MMCSIDDAIVCATCGRRVPAKRILEMLVKQYFPNQLKEFLVVGHIDIPAHIRQRLTCISCRNRTASFFRSEDRSSGTLEDSFDEAYIWSQQRKDEYSMTQDDYYEKSLKERGQYDAPHYPRKD